MSEQVQANPCTRCGKQRITLSTHKVKFGESVVLVSETVCPDSECQSIVEKQLEKEKKLREQAISLKQYRTHTREEFKKEEE